MNYNIQLHNYSINLKKHNVTFLITLKPTIPIHHKYNFRKPFIPQIKLTYIRNYKIKNILNIKNKIIKNNKKHKKILNIL